MEQLMIKAAEKMDKAVATTQQKFTGVRTSRANTGLLENILVEAYGVSMPLNQLGMITVPDAQMLMVTPFDIQNINSIEKSIMNSNLGLTPQNDGKVIRIPLPRLNEERRKELDKILRQEAEEGRVALRNIRREVLDEVKKNKAYSEDDQKRIQAEVQKVTDKYSGRIEELLENKLKEIKEI
jgi:ribosome recycling factor